MTMFPYIEAEYESGYVHREDEQDHSPYVRGSNIYGDIVHKRPESAHGKLVKFSLVFEDERFEVDFTVLPEGATPIRLRHMEGDFRDGGVVDARCVGITFGYEYNRIDGNTIRDVETFT